MTGCSQGCGQKLMQDLAPAVIVVLLVVELDANLVVVVAAVVVFLVPAHVLDNAVIQIAL